MNKIAVQLKETSQPIEHTFINTYEKGGFYCIYTTDEVVYKYPTQNIFRVIENYGTHGMHDDYDDMVIDAEVTAVDVGGSEMDEPTLKTILKDMDVL